MDFYLTELDSQSRIKFRLQFPMNPEKVKISTGVITQDYTVIGKGEIRIPDGNKLDSVSWDGILPAESLADMPYVKAWRDPKEVYEILDRYKTNGTKLQLLVTDSPIFMNVFIETFEGEIGGAVGTTYSITLTQYEDLLVLTENEAANRTTQSTTNQRPTPPKTNGTYTVKPGDSLWKIAQKELGKGSRYPEIQKLNLPALKDPNKISIGQILKMPKA